MENPAKDHQINQHPNAALYQLIGPIETLYQLVPIDFDGSNRSSTYRRDLQRLQQQQAHYPLHPLPPPPPSSIGNENNRNGSSRSLVLIPLGQPSPPPYFDEDEQDDDYDDFMLDFTADQDQYQLVPLGGYELQLFDEDLYQLAPRNELEAPMQLLAIEGPPQFQLVGPVPQLARIRCRFANESPRVVDLVWTDDNNRMYRYAKLANDEFVDITTFEGHQWIFCDALDGEQYLINPGRVNKFVANAGVGGDRDTNRGRRIRITAIRMANDLTLRKTTLRILAQRLFDAWEEATATGNSSSSSKPPQPPMNLLLQSMRLPLFIQIQLAQFVLSCILYQRNIESNDNNANRPLNRAQKQIFQWLVQFVRTHSHSSPMRGDIN